MSPRPPLRCGETELPLGERTLVMGIVNVTPDSFSDGGRFDDVEAALAHAERLLEEGADILDIGGESTRPGAAPVGVDEELARVLPVVEGLVARGINNLSVDTRRARCARVCLEAGASWVNDVSALGDPEMATVATEADALVLMHMRGRPEDMQRGEIHYDDVVAEVRSFLEERLAVALAAGVDRSRVLLDPGIGFGKRLEHNLALTRRLAELVDVAGGVLYGPSRKRFLGELTGIEDAAQRDKATLGAIGWAAASGADVVRVHDVKGAVEALAVVDALARAR
jgi:dihydropteroate synthase